MSSEDRYSACGGFNLGVKIKNQDYNRIHIMTDLVFQPQLTSIIDFLIPELTFKL